jgi:hypothetical protein
MATVYSTKTRRRKTMADINPFITDPDMRAMLGLPPLGANPLEAFLEQSLDPIARQGLNLDQYTQGVKTDPFGISNQGAINTNLGAANQVLSQLYAANPEAFRGGQFNPYSSFADFNARQNQRAGFNEGSDLGSFVSGGVQHLGDTASELARERGVQALALAGAGGSFLGGPAAGAGSAAAGGTAAGAAGGTGLTAGAGGLGLSPAAAGAAGLSPAYATGALAPGYFGAETLALGGAAGAGLSGGAGAGASVPTAPGVGVAAPAAGGAAAGLGGISSLLSSPAALGMAGGALLGGLGGSQQAGSITVEEGIPDWLQPYVKPALDKYSTDLQNYQIDPYGVMPSAMKEFQNTIGGMYLDPSTNKYLEDYFRLGAERIKGSLSPSFGHMQAFGQHSGYNEALSRGLGDFSTGLYGGAYNKERDRQSQLTAAAPAFLGQASQAAFQPYSQYLQSVGSLGKKKDQPYFENPFGNMLGGAFVGGSLGGMFK